MYTLIKERYYIIKRMSHDKNKSFIEKAIIVHKDTYIYDKVEYVNYKTNIIIECKEHGEFEQTPSRHLLGRGCTKCGRIKQGLSRRSTTESFITKAKKVHGDTYNYVKVKYINIDTKVIIICKDHGEFYQVPDDHLQGCGCPLCKVHKLKILNTHTKDTFIEKAIIVHKDTYIYDNVSYIDSQTEVIITCKEHGDFKQRPSSHIKGSGCPKCANLTKGQSQRYTLEQFIAKANMIHEYKYNYVKVKYINIDTKVIIICKDHGEFYQIPYCHLQGNGCRECANLTKGQSQRYTLEQFIEKASEIHGDTYRYDKVNYINSQTKIIIVCKEHGEFQQNPGSHIQGKGCPRCVKRGRSQIYTTEQFIEKAKLIHNNIYCYDKVNYINSQTKIIIVCKEHGEFQQTPCSHIQGTGCPRCIHKTEEFLHQYIKQLYIDVIPQYKSDWCINPVSNHKFEFDFYIPSLNLIVELDGGHHFNETYYNSDPVMMNKLKDIIKMKMAVNNGLHIIRMLQTDIYKASKEWLNSNILPELIKHEPGFSVITSDDTIYDSHIDLFEQLSLEDSIAMLEPYYENDIDSDEELVA